MEDEGIFSWDKKPLEEVNCLKDYDCTTLREKQLLMIGCCLELGYDLMINRDDNCSDSRWFWFQ